FKIKKSSSHIITPITDSNRGKGGTESNQFKHLMRRDSSASRHGTYEYPGTRRSQTAPIGTPLGGIADGGAVDCARTNAPDRRRDVKGRQIAGDRIERPGDAD